MCHHPKRFSEDCIDFNMHEEKESEHLADARKTSPKDLEEASEKYGHNKHPMTTTGAEESQEDFIAGAKWQEEKEKEYSPWLAIPGLKEAALEFGEQAKDYEIGGQSFSEDMSVAFTRGAEWQKEQDNIISRQAEAQRIKTQQMCYEKGLADMKYQMMKEAIPCKVFWHDGPLLDYTQEQQDNALERIGANVGDKVKLIIVKED